MSMTATTFVTQLVPPSRCSVTGWAPRQVSPILAPSISPANTLGIRRVAFAVDDIDAAVAGLQARGAEFVGGVERYEDSYRPAWPTARRLTAEEALALERPAMT
jgi:hypothetical protein